MQRYAFRAVKNIRSIDKKTVDLLHYYEWPGNIRELQNVIERSVIHVPVKSFPSMSRGSPKDLLGQHLRFKLRHFSRLRAEPRSEREIIEAALAETRRRVSGP